MRDIERLAILGACAASCARSGDLFLAGVYCERMAWALDQASAMSAEQQYRASILHNALHAAILHGGNP